jgi:hypothetical protein
MCRPGVHDYNKAILVLYNVCKDQLIMGANGPISISDAAIGHAMKEYFDVEKKDKLSLSLSVRNFSRKVIKKQLEKK